ncbi:MAG: SUMF1/EgtB/PvdO family nonheme iron enzyme, partial [Gemmatimonadota bacterium]
LVGPERFRLDTEESLPPGMVRVPGWTLETGLEALRIEDFFLGRYEVTNAEYRAFVEAGGYRRPELWSTIVVQGDTVPWIEAMQRFVDRTGRPGPSTWEAGDFPAGQDEYPVSGVSWYEADAYARFAAAELPTAFHWEQALANATFPWLLPASNFSGDGPRPVSEGHAMSHVAAYDLAGNVREWTTTRLGDDRVILGGNWNDPYYIAGTADASAPPEDRSAGNGFRLAHTFDALQVANRIRELNPRPTAVPSVSASPVSDDVYEAYARVFDYDRRPLLASLEAEDTTRLWVRERVSFDAAYGPERVTLHLYLPRDVAPPYQTVVYWPGWDTFRLEDVDEYFAKQLDFVVKSGRAVAFPVYRGTFGRTVGDRRSRPRFGTAEYRDNTVHTVNDLRRTLDYLETRPDIDRDAFAFFGYSWGGVNGPVALAQEPRLDVAVIDIGLLPPMTSTPEVDPVNALPRVHVPTLMLSGEFDPMVPEDNARRYFDLIGVSPEQKRHVIAIGGHFIPRPLLIRETLDWLDLHLGDPTEPGTTSTVTTESRGS